jgi:hypothetical protein
MRNRFDQLAKNILRDALQLLGTVETQAEVFSAPQAIDVWCVPDPARRAAGADLGMLAQIAPEPCLYLMVLSELPRTRETLLLRLLGAGRNLRAAIADLLALPEGTWERTIAQPWLIRCRIEVAAETSERSRKRS